MSILQKLNDFILETSDQAMKVVQEGTSLLLEGESDAGPTSTAESTHNNGNGNDINNDYNHDQDYYTEFDNEPSMQDMPNFESPLNGIADGVLNDIFQNQQRSHSTWENVQAFRSAIAWSEPFILSLLAMHMLFALAMIFTLRKGGLKSQFALLGSIFVIVRNAERLNGLGSKHWERIATQDYFDESGVFVSLMVSVPLFLVSIIMLICLLREAASLLVTVKKHELKAKARARKEASNGNGKKVRKVKKDKDKKNK